MAIPSSKIIVCRYDPVVERHHPVPELKVNYGVHVTEKNIEQLRKLNIACFPVRYGEQFYRDVVKRDPKLTILAYYADNLIGAIGCRVEENKLYIMTLCVLKPYRRMHIGRILLEKMLEVAAADESLTEMYLNVQTSNECAMAFYSQFGFEKDAEIRNYYRRLEPNSCFVLTKDLVAFRQQRAAAAAVAAPIAAPAPVAPSPAASD
ncbi:putative acetyltransferase; GNAT family protein [Paratrimastix pyriformis]|uniref:Acetyltransferase n=1 Tax=Paratrimastix pyriformis TaxID=342808 RepID=A0ABQ8URC8_9EUKA|nr:putative acetyltransferase; GNAT family protein [Paratrimastix pyriformis]